MGESDHPAFGTTASLSLHLASRFITAAGSVHISRGNNVVRMWVQLKRWCMSCVWVLQRGHSGDGVICRRLCVREIVCSELGKSATSEAGKHLFRAANVW